MAEQACGKVALQNHDDDDNLGFKGAQTTMVISTQNHLIVQPELGWERYLCKGGKLTIITSLVT